MKGTLCKMTGRKRQLQKVTMVCGKVMRVTQEGALQFFVSGVWVDSPYPGEDRRFANRSLAASG